MKIKVGQRTYQINLVDNATSRALAQMLPMTIQMSELNGNEKYCYLPQSLPTCFRRVGKIQAGDVMLYGDNCIVIFYQSFVTGYAYTNIGRIENGADLAAALGSGAVQVDWSL